MSPKCNWRLGTLLLSLPKKKELLRKEFLTQIENLYPKLMGNNHVQNLDFFFIFFVSYATCCPFHSKVISTEESGLNILTNTHKSCSGVGCWLPLTPALRFHYLCLYCPVRLWFQLCIHTIVPGFLNIYPVFSQRFVGFSIQLLRLASYSRCWQ
jgi:hypothetical protein